MNLPFPWEKFGVPISKGDRYIIGRADLNWTVTKNPMQAQVMDKCVPIPGAFALVREPDCTFLDTCGKSYQPTQNAELFAFWKAWLSQTKHDICWAGHMNSKRWVYALSKTQYGFYLGSAKDRVEVYFMMAHPHFCGESSRPLVLMLRTINMTSLSYRIPLPRIFSPIDKDSWTGPACRSAREAVERAKKLVHETEMKFVKLLDRPITDDQAKRYFTKVAHPRAHANAFKEYPVSTYRMLDYFHRGPGHDLPSAINSWWGAFQAACYYLERIGSDEQHSFYEHMLGIRSNFKRKALELAVTLAENAP